MLLHALTSYVLFITPPVFFAAHFKLTEPDTCHCHLVIVLWLILLNSPTLWSQHPSIIPTLIFKDPGSHWFAPHSLIPVIVPSVYYNVQYPCGTWQNEQTWLPPRCKIATNYPPIFSACLWTPTPVLQLCVKCLLTLLLMRTLLQFVQFIACHRNIAEQVLTWKS